MDLFNDTVLKRALSPVSVADDTVQTTQIIDTQGFDAVMFGILTGSLADADVTFTVVAKENDANSTSGSTDVADANLTGTEALAGFRYDDDNEVRKLLIRPTKRYVYLTITPSGNGSAALLSAFAQLIGSNYLPTTQPAA